MSSITQDEFRRIRSNIHDINTLTANVIDDVAFIRNRHKSIKPELLIARLIWIESRIQMIRTRMARIDGLAIDLVEIDEGAGHEAII